jgi:hypothetical protein
MAWRSVGELTPHFETIPQADELVRLAVWSRLFGSAFTPKDYKPDPRWLKALALTTSGQKHFDRLRVKGHDPDSAAVAIFWQFFYSDFLIDHQKTDHAIVESIVSGELRASRLRIPYRFGKEAYEEFHLHFADETRANHLEPPQVDRLLERLPQGVSQFGTVLCGPLGLSTSGSSRLTRLSPRMPLRHCDDTGCSAIHEVELFEHETEPVLAVRALGEFLSVEQSRASEWDLVIHDKLGIEKRFHDIASLVGDTIQGEERAVLAEHALLGLRKTELRELLERAGKSTKLSAPKLARSMSCAEQLQVILTLSNSELVNLLDELLWGGTIRLPMSETRLSRPEPTPSRRAQTEMSSLGVRSVEYNPGAHLVSSVISAYEKSGMGNDLKWRLRRHSEIDARDALFRELMERGPSATIKDYVLSSRAVTMAVSERLSCADVGGDLLVDRLAWKFGFDVPRHEDAYKRFQQRLDRMRSLLLGESDPITEDKRDAIRSVGVNVFVSVEEFLSHLISYLSWMLGSDHFVSTKFRYDPASALASVPKVLSAPTDPDGRPVPWSPVGENALGTLLRYFSRLVEWVRSLPERERTSVLRPDGELPHYESDEVLRFPFHHRQLWADLDVGRLQLLVTDLSVLADMLNASDLAAVRNGLDHYRDQDRFPRIDKMIACVGRLEQALVYALAKRLVPKYWWCDSVEVNRHKWNRFIFSDEHGERFELLGPSLVIGAPHPAWSVTVIPPGMLLGARHAQFVFSVKERSAYTEYWRDYPKRRMVSLGNELGAGEGASSSDRTLM